MQVIDLNWLRSHDAVTLEEKFGGVYWQFKTLLICYALRLSSLGLGHLTLQPPVFELSVVYGHNRTVDREAYLLNGVV